MLIAIVFTVIWLCSPTEAITLNARDRRQSIQHFGEPNNRCPLTKTLSAWNGPNHGQWHVTLYMFGDSLVRNSFDALCATATGFTQPSMMVVMTDDPWTRMKQKMFIHTCEIPLPRQSTLLVAFIGKHEAGTHRIDLLEVMRKNLRKPDILYFDSGMHFLHTMPVSNQWSFYPLWLNYEASFEQFLNHPIVQDVPKLVFLTSHWICEAKYVGDYGKLVKLINKDAKKAAQPCVDFVTEKYVTHYNETESGMKFLLEAHKASASESTGVSLVESFDGGPTHQCMDGWLNAEGTHNLNERALRVIGQHHKHVGVIDGYGITQNRCEETDDGDGRHYNHESLREELKQLWTTQAEAKGATNFTYLTEMNCGVNYWHARCEENDGDDPECDENTSDAEAKEERRTPLSERFPL